MARFKEGRKSVMAKLVLAYGTTITVNLQGSNDGGVTYTTIATGTYTSGTPKYLHAPAGRSYRRYRLNISVNTGCTVTKGYIGTGKVEN